MKKEILSEISDGSVDAGLIGLFAIAEKDLEFTQDEIAFVCGCSRQNIQKIENRAMRKIKKQLLRRGIKKTF